jgi:hypothetical protein
LKPVKGSIVDRNEGLSRVNESGTLVIHMGLYSRPALPAFLPGMAEPGSQTPHPNAV